MTTITHSQSRRGLKATHDLGSSKANQALMVRIDWTTASTIKITARQAFKLEAVTMDVHRKEVIATPSMTVPAGAELYFVASSIPGYYYIARIGAAGQVGCTCCGFTNAHHCKHQELVSQFAARPRIRQMVEVSAPEPVVSQPATTSTLPAEELARLQAAIARAVAAKEARMLQEAEQQEPLDWKALDRRNKEWQRQQKQRDLEKLAEVKALAQASAAA